MAMDQKSFEEQNKIKTLQITKCNLLVAHITLQITKRDVAVQCNYLVPMSGCYG